MDEQTTGSQSTKPRTYTDEYRRQVVDMVTSTGRTAMSVAAELGEAGKGSSRGAVGMPAEGSTTR